MTEIESGILRSNPPPQNRHFRHFKVAEESNVQENATRRATTPNENALDAENYALTHARSEDAIRPTGNAKTRRNGYQVRRNHRATRTAACDPRCAEFCRQFCRRFICENRRPAP